MGGGRSKSENVTSRVPSVSMARAISTADASGFGAERSADTLLTTGIAPNWTL